MLEPTFERRRASLSLALQEAMRRQQLAEQGFFNRSQRTCNIEHELQCVDCTTGFPASAQAFLDSQHPMQARFDTTLFNVEYDAGDIAQVEAEQLEQLYHSFQDRTRIIQRFLSAHSPQTIVVPIGVQPLLPPQERDQWVVPDEELRERYRMIAIATTEENPQKTIHIENPLTGEVFTDKALNMAAMSYCSGTQFHISERTVEDALEAHHISIFIAPLMIALFGNSPFIAGLDTGRASTRMELLRQAEQLRTGFTRPAQTLYEYYAQLLTRALPAFPILDDPGKALDLAHSAFHTVSRIQVDMVNGTIRNEFRHIDSQSPYGAMQAFLLTLGAVDGLRGRSLATFEEMQENYRQCVWGLRAPMSIQGRICSLQTFGKELLALAMQTLAKQGLANFARPFLESLDQQELAHGGTQADEMRASVYQKERAGLSRPAAITSVLQTWNRAAL